MATKKPNTVTTAGKGSQPKKKAKGGGGGKGSNPLISQNAIDATNAQLGRGSEYAQNLVDKVYTDDQLKNSQVNTGRSGETSDMINRHLQLANTYNGQIPQQQQDYLNAMQQRAGQVSQITPQQQAYLSQQMQIAQNGYNAPQFNALYEQTRGDQSQQNQGAQRALAQQIGQSGVRGPAAGAQYNQLAQQQMMNDRKLNQGLYTQGMQYQTGALNQYGQDLGSYQGQANQAGNEAYANLGNQMGTYSQNAVNNQGQALTNLNAVTTAAQQNELDRQKYNIGAYNSNLAGKLGTYTGGIGAYTGAENAQNANEIAQGNTDWARKHYNTGSVG